MSDVVGTILLVGITVITMAGLSFVVLNTPGPADKLHAQVNVDVLPGPDGQWGTGDEIVRLSHRGGEALPQRLTIVHLIVDGTAFTYQGSGLGGAFSNGSFSIGDIHTLESTIRDDSVVAVDVIVRGESSTLVAAKNLRMETITGAGT